MDYGQLSTDTKVNVKTEILYGIHPVVEALKAGRRDFFEVYISKDKISKRLEKVVAFAESRKIPIKKVKLQQLKSMAGTDMHQGIGVKASIYPLAEISDIVDNSKSADANHFLLLLDNVLDPHNLGAIIRTALCVGIDGIVIPRDRSASPTPAVSKASAGALEHVFLARVTNMVDTIKALKKKGVWIAGMDMAADRSIFSTDFTGSIAIVIGGEEKGIRPLVKKHCDFLISIPQIGGINSLNASVAGAVVMYEAFRQRSMAI
jgi:23S rRNA (guanosine2251-2'-O)-methyltransferase